MTGVTEAHFKAFGALTYHYAQVEVNLQKCLAGMLDINPKVAIILSAPYRAVDLRRVVKSVAKELEWPNGALEEFVGIVGESKEPSQLRNHIAHSQWVPGKRTGAIKPIGLDILNEKARTFGHLEEERDWTADEIENVASKLADLVIRIVQFSQKTNIASNIAKHVTRLRG